MKRIFLIAALLALPPMAASAAIDSNALVAQYQSEGYSTIEVTRGLNQTKLEAIKDSVKIEIIYDNETGAVLKSETGAVEAGDDIRPGVTVRDRNRDFVKAVGHDDDDDNGDDDANDDDNGDDDNGDDENDDRDDDEDDDKDDDHNDDDKGDDNDDN